MYLTNIHCSTTPKVMGIKLLPAGFGNISSLDLERLKKDDKWLSDNHVTISLMWVPFSFFNSLLNKTGIVFEIVKASTFGGAKKSNSSIPPFGPNCHWIKKGTPRGIEENKNCWSTIS
jgi:hypothetical protein